MFFHSLAVNKYSIAARSVVLPSTIKQGVGIPVVVGGRDAHQIGVMAGKIFILDPNRTACRSANGVNDISQINRQGLLGILQEQNKPNI
jgi:hypothetical protein